MQHPALSRSNPLTILLRWFKYNIVAASTFLVDIFLFSTLTYLDAPQSVAVTIAFVVAVSLNYLINRTWAFRGTERAAATGYSYFITIAAAMLGLTLIFMHFAVPLLGAAVPALAESFGENATAIVARIIVASAVGTIHFFTQSLVTFRML